MISRRTVLSSTGAAAASALICTALPRPAAAALPPISQADHEKYMRMAIAESAHTRKIPSASVIVKPATGEVMARGINNSDYDPTLHGEMSCIRNYIERNGNREWEECVIYTIAEPCTMCQSALVFAGIGGTVFGSSNESIHKNTPLDNPRLRAKDIIDGSPFYKGFIIGGILSAETDKLFIDRASKLK
jgi:tRNA(Arg) A34 adenosine deaminase TadA